MTALWGWLRARFSPRRRGYTSVEPERLPTVVDFRQRGEASAERRKATQAHLREVRQSWPERSVYPERGRGRP